MQKFLKMLCVLALVTIAVITGINIYINRVSSNSLFTKVSELPSAYTALVLGAHVSKEGVPSSFLHDRLETAWLLYQQKKVKRLLLSGDHGTIGYDEVNNMRNYLLEKGVDTRDIFLDHAGFDTYNSIVRARDIFGVNEMIVVSQEFHLPRALYIANGKKVKAYGIVADQSDYGSLRYLKFRERIACLKAFIEVLINKEPKFRGEKIPITGDSRKSYDR
jgi:SanA protein